MFIYKIEDTNSIPRWYCSKCGSFYDTDGTCNTCGSNLMKEEFSLHKRICDKCGQVFQSTLSYFESNDSCLICHEGTLVKPEIRNQASSVFIDGSWNGVPVGKKIQEKNEQLKRKHAGYSYEQDTMKGKISEMVNNKIDRM